MSSPLPTLDQLLDEPQLELEIGGVPLRFSPLPMAALARLQAWIKANVPHPLDALRPHLAGYAPHLQEAAVKEAVRGAQAWPPRLDRPDGSAALLTSKEGQVETLFEGLQVHYPGVTREHAFKVYAAIEREGARRRREKLDPERTAARIYSVLFGNGDPGAPGPKA